MLLVRDCPHVYLLQFGVGNPIKIGHTRHIERRWHTISASHWLDCTIFSYMPAHRSAEAILHERFAHLRRGRSEWFECHKDLLDLASQMSSDNLVYELTASVALGADLRSKMYTNGRSK